MGATISDDLAGKRAVVTGGTRGIGAAIAQNLIDAGATVVVGARTTDQDTPSAAKFVAADLGTPHGVQRFAEEALTILGGVDVIVNNVGGCRQFQSVLDIESDWQYTMDINFLAPVRLNAALVPTMRENGGGVIVHISSIATISPYQMIMQYAAAKAALEMYSRGLAVELAPEGIRVVAISPGNVDTPSAEAARVQILDYLGQSAEDVDPQSWADEVPIGRTGQGRDIADAVNFLVSDRASWITGSNLVIDGGRSASL